MGKMQYGVALMEYEFGFKRVFDEIVYLFKYLSRVARTRGKV